VTAFVLLLSDGKW